MQNKVIAIKVQALCGEMTLNRKSNAKGNKSIRGKNIALKSVRKGEKTNGNFHSVAIAPVAVTSNTAEKINGPENNTGSKGERDRSH